MAPLYALTKDSARRVAAATRQVLDGVPGSGATDRRRYARADGATYCGLLVDDLDAPTDGWTEATYARVRIYLPDPAWVAPEEPEPEDPPPDPLPPPWHAPRDFVAGTPEEDWTVTAINRDPSLSGSADTFCKIHRVHGEWQFLWVGC